MTRKNVGLYEIVMFYSIEMYREVVVRWLFALVTN